MKYVSRLIAHAIIMFCIFAPIDRWTGKPFDASGWIMATIVAFGVSVLFVRAYRRGQIDALNGVIKYEKQTNSDGETVWVERKQ